MATSSEAEALSDACMAAQGFQSLSVHADRFQLALASLADAHKQEVYHLQQQILKLREQVRELNTMDHDFKAKDKPVEEKYQEDKGRPLAPARTSTASTMMTSVMSTASTFGGEQADIFQRIVHDVRFELTVAVLIFCYAIVMALHMQYKGLDRGYKFGVDGYDEPASDVWPGMDLAMDILNLLFNIVFCMEFALRIVAYRCKAWHQVWMWIDGVLVTAFILRAVGVFSVNPSMMRLLRLARLIRVIKMLQLASHFHSLFCLLKSVHASGGALLWSFFFLLTIQSVVGMFLQQVIFYWADESATSEDQVELFQYFGTFTRTSLTMFQLTHGNWAQVARSVDKCLGNDSIGEMLAFVIAMYRCMLCFALVRVIQAVFISETAAALKHDEELQMMKRQHGQEHSKRKFLEIFRSLDTSSNGYLEWEEFQAVLEDDSMKNKFSTLEIDTYDLHRLFSYLDDGDGRIDIDEFITGTMRAKGEAKCLDLQHVLGDLRKLAKKFDAYVLMASNGALQFATPDCSPTNLHSRRNSFSTPSNVFGQVFAPRETTLPTLSPLKLPDAPHLLKLPERVVPSEHSPIIGIGQFGANRAVIPPRTFEEGTRVFPSHPYP